MQSTREPLGPCTDPPAHVDYSAVLREPGHSPAVGVLGIAGALLGYALVVPLVLQILLGAGWLVSGRAGTYKAYTARADAYETIWGLIATDLALASLIPVVLVLARYIQHRSPKWVCSVQPGMRWRYLLVVALVAVVVLNLTQVLSRGGEPYHFTVPHLWWAWVLAILITSPLQAAAEEFFFRGYLMGALGSVGANKWVSAVGSALIFALFHGTQNLWLFIDRFSFGLAAGVLVILTGGLEAGIAAHAVNNLFAFGYAVFQGGAATARGVTSMDWQAAVWDVGGSVCVALAAWSIGRAMRIARRTPSIDAPGRRTGRALP